MASPDDTEIVPALALCQSVLFPGTRCHVVLETVQSYGAVREATRSWGRHTVAVFAARADAFQQPTLFDIGALAEVLALFRWPCGDHWVAELRTLGRVHAREHLKTDPFRVVRIAHLREPRDNDALLRALVVALRDSAERIATLDSRSDAAEDAVEHLQSLASADEVLAAAMGLLEDLPIEERQRALELPSLGARLEYALCRVHRRLAILGDGKRHRLLQ